MPGPDTPTPTSAPRGRDIYPFDEIEPRSRALWDKVGLFRQDEMQPSGA